MPGGIYDSSKTRVAPVFNALRDGAGDWVRRLISLTEGSAQAHEPSSADLTFLGGAWDNSKGSGLKNAFHARC